MQGLEWYTEEHLETLKEKISTSWSPNLKIIQTMDLLIMKNSVK